MKEFPELNVSMRRIYDISLSPVRAGAVAAGVKLKIFDHLTKPLTAKELAEISGYNPGTTETLLNVLAASGLLVKKDGLFLNSPDTEQYLVSSSDTYYGDILLREYRRITMNPETIADLVKYGPDELKDEDSMVSEDFWADYARSMANWERSGTAQVLAEKISCLSGFDSFRAMLDLGGGPGLMGMAVLKKHPAMTGVLFDRPGVAEVAEEFIGEYGLAGRMTAVGGDYLRDSFGEGYDLVMCSCTLNFARGCMDEMTGKIYRSLNPGGIFVSLHDGICKEGTTPEYHILNMMSSALSGFNCSLDKGFILDSMLRSGFDHLFSETVELDVGDFDLDVGRKPGTV